MRDVLLQIDTYAEPTQAAVIEQAAKFVALLGGRIAGLATHIDITVPRNWLAEKLLNVSQLAEIEEGKSLAAARRSLQLLAEIASTVGVEQDGRIGRSPLHGVGGFIAECARTRDLCLVAVGLPGDSQRGVAEEIIFGSGRPVLVFHPERAPLPKDQLKRVAVAWDGSRCAARAAADAIPILCKALEVRILTVVGEKKAATSGIACDLVRHLRAHDIQAQVDEFEGRDRSIGASLDAYCDEHSPDLLVMGAYGTSRVKEFLLGGATEHILNAGRVATFLSH